MGKILKERCSEILNTWIDCNSDFAVEQLRSLLTEGAITNDEYDYIMNNWEELVWQN